MALPITPELIPHEEFHTGRWLLAVERPTWYYFLHQKSLHEVHDRRFLQSVDTPLRELVQWLHNRGIPTTPSCAGHLFRREDLVRVFDNLVLDAAAIQSSGLVLKDVESGECLLHVDHDYQLPWNREQFLHALLPYQKKGVLGFRLTELPIELIRRLKRYLSWFRSREIRVVEKGTLLLVLTNSETNEDIHRNWRIVTQCIQRALKQA